MPSESRRRIVVRYALFQIPDLLILVLILFVVQWLMDPRSWLYGIIVGLWIIKDILMFPLVWRSYERPLSGAARSFIGTEGVAVEQLDPLGYIQVHGELWQAEVMEKKVPIKKGETVSVKGAKGITLLVEPVAKR